MKKNLLAAAMVVGTAACGSSTNADTGSGQTAQGSGEEGVTTDNITLTYWHYEDETTINTLAEKFMEKYPNITVETKVISDMSTDLSAAAAAGQFPDVFVGTDSDTALANMYWADITDYYNNDPETANLMATINEYGIGIISGSGSTILGIFDKDIDIKDDTFTQIKVCVNQKGVIVND